MFGEEPLFLDLDNVIQGGALKMIFQVLDVVSFSF